MLRAIAFLLLFTCNAFGAVHGLNTTFDPARWGGSANVTCLQAAIAGKCDTGFGAACNGIADDSAAYLNWVDYAIAHDPVVLYVPPGSICQAGSNGGFGFAKPGASAHVDGTPIKNITVWAYGASFNALIIGTQFVPFPDNTHSALLQTTHVNDTSLTLKSAGDAALFTANTSQIIVSCLSTQRVGGYPPNWQIFEYNSVTTVAGTAVGLASPLKYACKSTYPQADPGDATNVNQGGPATAYVLNAAWNSNITIYGLTVLQQANAVFSAAKTISLINFNAANANGLSPSMANTYTVTNSPLYSTEFDKNVDTLVLTNVTGKQFLWQSASMNNVTMNNVVLSQSMLGTPTNAIINGLKTPDLKMGPTLFGHGNTFVINNSTVTFADNPASNICMPSIQSGNTDLTYASGRFTMPKTASGTNRDNIFRWAMPGQKYYFADSDGTNNSTPQTNFAITDFSEDASNYFVDTGSWQQGGSSIATPAVLPTPTCNTHSCPCYTSYQASSITQTNTGPADLTVFAAPP